MVGCALGLVVTLEPLTAVRDGHLRLRGLRDLPASLNAMAIACFRLVTFAPLPGPGLPVRSVPRLYSPITFSTFDFAIPLLKVLQG